MRELAELIATGVEKIAISSRESLIMRALVALTGVAALLLVDQWSGAFINPLFFWIGIGLLLGTVLNPDGFWFAILVGLVMIWWVLGASGAPLWQAASVALLLAAGHQLTSFLALGPTHAAFTGAARRRLVTALVTYLVMVAAGLGIVVGAALVPGQVVPRGLVWIAAAVIAVIALIMLVSRRRQKSFALPHQSD